MMQDLSITLTLISDELISVSVMLDEKMEKWSDVSKRPHDLSTTECVGFVNKETAASELNLVVDIQAPADKDEAILRTWGIESKLGDDQIERFNNIQLDFIVDYPQARELAQKGGDVTRDDIRELLNDQNTKLTHVVVSNQSGFDKSSQQPLGERYDLYVTGPDELEDTIGKAGSALNAVLLTLKKSAAAETNS